MLNAKFVKKFKKHFVDDTLRWDAFQYIAKRLDSLRKPIFIVETGCMRQPGNWMGDGQSTVLFGWIAKETGGLIMSIDISEENIETVKTHVPNVNAINMDSILALRKIADAETIDLLYLDSMDLTKDWRSPLHHVGELAAIYDRLKSGCLIAVDDNTGMYGKDRYIRMFFGDIGLRPIYTGYVTIWEKP